MPAWLLHRINPAHSTSETGTRRRTASIAGHAPRRVFSPQSRRNASCFKPAAPIHLRLPGWVAWSAPSLARRGCGSGGTSYEKKWHNARQRGQADSKLILKTYHTQNDDARLVGEASKIDFGLTNAEDDEGSQGASDE